MADAIVMFLIEKLTRLLEERARLLASVKNDVTLLQNELKFIMVFLQKSERKRREHDVVAEVVRQIRDVAYEAEDVIDTYVADMIIHERRNMMSRVVVRGVSHTEMLRNVAEKITKIKTDIKEILDNKDKYDNGGACGDYQVQEAERIRKQRREVEEEDVVGLVHDSKVVIDHLMAKDSSLKVVSIVGMGGLGKTTLARKIFNNKAVKDKFPRRAWGYASNVYRPREFFLSLLKWLLCKAKYAYLLRKRHAQAEEESISEEELKMKVRKCLNKRSRYLVVVDDVWEDRVWDEVKDAFPDKGNGSRILVTTRLTEVASHTGPTPPYTLPFLNKEQSWELLSKNVFWGKECPSGLETRVKSIAERCHGLPLAIIVMAGILANKSQEEWSGIEDHVNWYLGRDNTLKDTLRLSYHNLPARLKPCFLYFGMYPEGYEIPVKQLIRLWISEGFLIQETHKTLNTPELEYIAKGYLNELVDRSLIQVVSGSNDGGVKTCKIHNLLHDLCITESRDDKFSEVWGTEIDSQTHTSCPRRLSLQGTLSPFTSSSSTLSDSCISGMRSLLCFGQEVYKVKANHWRWLLKSFKLARVLDLGPMEIDSIPSDLEELIHLRYLRIHNNFKTIPASICRLWSLETLDLRGSPIKSFSSKPWQLKQLRHLLMSGPVRLANMISESETMPNLQTLSTVALDPRTASLLDNHGFPKLKKLGLHYKKCNPSIQLQSLRCLSHLWKLKMIGTTEIPQNAADVFPSTITKITLTEFGFFNSTAMNILEKLPNLQVLKLSSQKNNTSFDLHCTTGGFPQLQVFVMVEIEVKSWILEKGSMPRVRRLVIGSCKSLTELPKELWSFTTLREVQVLWPCTELAEGLKKLAVNNRCKLVVYPLSTNEELDFL